MLTVKTVDDAISKFLENEESNDSLYSVKKWQTRLYNKNSEAINHNIKELLPTQDLEPIYEENSCMYIFSKKSLIDNNHRDGNNPYMYVMNDIESQDIDIETDFKLSEIILREFYLNVSNVVLIIWSLWGYRIFNSNSF